MGFSKFLKKLTGQFLTSGERERIDARIADANSRFDGEIKLVVESGKPSFEAAFLGAGLSNDRAHVLILLLPGERRNKGVIRTSQFLDRIIGPAPFKYAASLISEGIEYRRQAPAIVEAIRYLGGFLSNHFPPLRSAGPSLDN